MGIDDKHWMQQAYLLAKKAEALGEVPVGALLVSADNQVLGRGYNQVIQKQNPLLHAEMVAMSEAASALGNYRLLHTTLYVTLEPCCMCAGAMVHARINRLVYGARDVKAGAAGSMFQLLKGAPLNHAVHVDEGVLEAPCSALLRQFFESKR